jgi:hypothetical protein
MYYLADFAYQPTSQKYNEYLYYLDQNRMNPDNENKLKRIQKGFDKIESRDRKKWHINKNAQDFLQDDAKVGEVSLKQKKGETNSDADIDKMMSRQKALKEKYKKVLTKVQKKDLSLSKKGIERSFANPTAILTKYESKVWKKPLKENLKKIHDKEIGRKNKKEVKEILKPFIELENNPPQKVVSTKTPPTVTTKNVAKKATKGLGKKLAIGLGGTAAVLGGAYALNKLRKSRSDKGKTRGRYKR